MVYDILIKNGFIADGTGAKGYYGDIGIKNGKILHITKRMEPDAKGEKILDAGGLTVCPGFIDPHTHEELNIFNDNKFEKFLRQGVTTVICGNCGHSVTPYSSDNIYEYMYKNALISGKEKRLYKYHNRKWTNLEEYIEAVKSKKMNINMGFLLGYGSIRWSIVKGDMNRKPSGEEKDEIRKVISQGMEQGALGISTGLSYIPCIYADTCELLEIGSLIKKYGGIFTSHIRYGIGVLEAVKEIIGISRESSVRAQISHLTPTVPEAFDEILKAKERGIEVAVDTIPLSSAHFVGRERFARFLTALTPSLFNCAEDTLYDILKTAEGRKRILHEASSFLNGAGNFVLVNKSGHELENKTIMEIAEECGMSTGEFLLQLISNKKNEFTICMGKKESPNFPEKPHPRNIVDNPLVMVGSDTVYGEFGNPHGWYELFRSGAFPVFFNMYEKEGVMPETIIERVTSLPARQFGLTGRGLLREGYAADISVINTSEYSYPGCGKIDCSNPVTFAGGVKHVIVNGKIVMEDGVIKRSLPGEVLYMKG